jgi:hypothetical protein
VKRSRSELFTTEARKDVLVPLKVITNTAAKVSPAQRLLLEEEMEHIRRRKHGARSPEQAIAIGLSKARRRS